MRVKVLLCVTILIISLGMSAQTEIRGKVLDGSTPDKEPLIGANIHVPGTTAGTISDLGGNFSFTLPEGKSLIQVSMEGYKTQVIHIIGKASVEDFLLQDSNNINQGVVVGYGTRKKRDHTGSMTPL